MISKPLLASNDSIKTDELSTLTYPVWVTPKLDGIRTLITPCPGSEGETQVVAMSRKLIEIPNLFVQEWAEQYGIDGMDGEIVVPGWSFHEIQSWVMSEVTLPINWLYYVFDWHRARAKNYLQRLQIAEQKIEKTRPPHVRLLLPVQCDDPQKVLAEFKGALRAGHEGIIIRSNDYYKQGRSTRMEGIMLKMKAFEDAEAKIVDFIPEYHNENIQQRDNTGAAKRSSHKSGKTARKRLGALVVENGFGQRFKIGSGFNHSLKTEIWKHRGAYRGRYATYTHQPYGQKILPRCPIFKGIRYD